MPFAAAVVMFGVGMAFEFFWIPTVYHQSRWFTQGDVWGMFRAAHFVGWGDLGGIYTSGNGVVTFPGMAILLAPVAMLSGALHLTESYNGVFLAHPTAVLLVLPVELVLASTVIFAADALAQDLGASRARRVWSCMLVALLAWPTAVLWGHAEDALVMTLALCAMRAALGGRWARTGWLFGLAIVIQPLIALVIPLFLAASPPGRRLMFAVRCAALSAFTVGVAFLGNPSGTYRALVQQPTPPDINHPTPWVALAPKVATASNGVDQGSAGVPSFGRGGFSSTTVIHHTVANVSGGPGRTIDVLLAVVLAAYVWRRPQPPVRLLWLAAAVLASRCFFEAVMTPYYLTPPLILLVVLAARTDTRRLLLAGLVTVGVSVYAYLDAGPWGWWLPVVGGLTAVLALTYPTVDGPVPHSEDGSPGRAVRSRSSGAPPRPAERDMATSMG
ncbi:MAG TPA: hypothetical protein VND44_06345 [Acidimicrobiales bacterium]|nr:hypothetical protein [Acidimicrobiales bacterium]HVC67197.1 hypothetical protein [Acidimicrobiales bacterium]